MPLKRVYSLKNQRISQYNDDLPKACVCVFLVMVVICGFALAAVYIVKMKNTQSIAEENKGESNYQDIGNRKTLQFNDSHTTHPSTKNDVVVTSDKRKGITTSNTIEYSSKNIEALSKDVPPTFHTSTVSPNDSANRETLRTNNSRISYPNTRNDFVVTSDKGNRITTSNTIEHTSTNIESPLYTSTDLPIAVPPTLHASTVLAKDDPPRFLIVNTVNDSGTSNSDYYSRAGSASELGTSSTVKRSAVDYVKTTTDGLDTSSIVKRSTVSNHDEIIKEKAYIAVYVSPSNKDPTTSTLMKEQSTPRHNFDLQEEHGMCTTDSCKQSLRRMIALVNHTAEPCDDFYSYACGGFVINHFEEFTVNDKVLEKLPDMSTLNVSVPYKKLYRDFLTSCTNYKNGRDLAKVAEFMYYLCVNHTDSLTDFIADIIMLHPRKTLSRLLPLFDVVMEEGPKGSLMPLISLPKLDSLLSEDDKETYERSCRESIALSTTERNKTIIQEMYRACTESEYLASLEESIIRLQIFEHLPDYKTKKQAITYTIRFIKEKIIDQLGSISDDELRNARQDTVAVKWLSSTYSQINWNQLFERLFGTEVAKNIAEVRITHVEYLVKIFEFYKSNKFMEVKTSILSMMSVDFNFDFVEPHSVTDHFKYCSTTATKLMPDIASKLYLDSFSSSDIENADKKLQSMFKQLVVTFNAALKQNKLIHENVRKDVSAKMSGLNLMTKPYQGFARFADNYHKLYSAVTISTTDYFSNVMALKKLTRRRMYNTIGQSVISPEIIWNHLVWPISSSPIRITETTAIVLPTSLIAPFTTETQKIEEFSTIGFVVAQEISRFLYIDKTSKLFVNDNNNIRVEAHLQDPAYTIKPNIYGIQLNDEDISASQPSRLVDDEALRVSFNAYDQFQSASDKLTPWTSDSITKMFFTLASQQFCNGKKSSVDVAIDLIRNENLPNYFRVNSMMANSDTFSEAFECQPGA